MKNMLSTLEHWVQVKDGVILSLTGNKKTIKGQLYADCPFCSHKTENGRGFTVNLSTGLFFCPVCGESGNSFTLGKLFKVKFQNNKENGNSYSFDYFNQYGEIVGVKTEIRECDILTGKRVNQYWEKISGNIRIPGKPTEPIFHGRISDTTFIVEGEKKVWALNQIGLNAITQGGANNWNSSLNYLLENKKVILIPDCDLVGRKAFNNLATELFPLASSVKIIDIDQSRSDGYDIADYLRDNGIAKTKSLIQELIRNPKNGIKLNADILPVISYSLFSDSANAERLSFYFGDKIKFSSSGWLVWDSTRWSAGKDFLVTEYFKSVTKEIISEMPNYNPADKFESKEIEKWQKFIQKSQDKTSIVNSIELAKSMPEINLGSSKLDTNKYKLNLINGTYNFITGKLENHSQSDLITKRVDIVYNEGLNCANWIQFLYEIFNSDTELIKYIQKLVGISLTGNTDYQSILFLYGTGRNGKSVFVETVKRLLGDYSATTPTTTLMSHDRKGGATPDLAVLQGKRAVFANETSEGSNFDEELIKSLTGGDEISVRNLYSNQFSFKPEFKLWLVGNHKPTIKGNDTGIKRRVKLIPFSVTIGLEQVKERSYFDDLFGRELAGILNWAIEGWNLYKSEGICEPLAVTSATSEYIESNDIIALFAEECCLFGTNNSCVKSDLYKRYTDWCEDSGLKAKSKINFTKSFTARFPEIRESRNSTNRYFDGVSLSR